MNIFVKMINDKRSHEFEREQGRVLRVKSRGGKVIIRFSSNKRNNIIIATKNK